MKNRFSTLLILLLLVCATASAEDSSLKIKITKKYLNFPVSHKMERRRMTFCAKGEDTCRFVIRLAEGEPDYFVFRDVSKLCGKTVTLRYEGSLDALAKVFQDDHIADSDSMYMEAFRPQYHFTTRRGWINDPNGLIFYNGRYHMFYQHNPYEREWENMHWGHAVSTDLLHWKELPDALHPDNLGTIFSGSAVIDYANTSGFASRKGDKPLVAVYTSTSDKQRQSIAYSTDEAETFTKYAGNPVIDSHDKWQSMDTRDPKVFWYEPSKHWVMVLNERDGHSIYNSPDLKTWTFQSHTTGFWECPELFELPVDGNSDNKKWVMWGASGTYMIGSFDGKTFTPETPKLCNLNGAAYAAQTINNLPTTDGRVIKIAWGRISFDDMPFNGCMLLPQEQLLMTTNSGIRLISRPIQETEQLFTKAYEGRNLTADEANEALKQFGNNDVLRIRATIKLSHSTDAGLRFRGQKLIDYDMNGNRLNGEFYATDEPGSMFLTADVYVDRGMVEVFIDGGRFSYSLKRDVRSRNNDGYTFYGNRISVENLEVFNAKSIWEGYED